MTRPQGDLRSHLVRTHLAGDVQTSPGHVRRNCEKLLEGDDRYTFGLADWHDASLDEVIEAVRRCCGDAAVDRPSDGPGWIDPDSTIEVLDRQADILARHAADRSRVLIATGHPTGLLIHYVRLADALRRSGCEVLTPLDDTKVGEEAGQRRGVRFLGGAACVWSGGELLHTHRSMYAEAMLDQCDAAGRTPDLVVGDHGMAGAAVERSIETVSIADVNDPALFLAATRGRTDAVLPIDDNLAPTAFEPVTTALLSAIG